MMTDTQPINIQQTTNSRIHELDEHNIPFGKLYADHMFTADYTEGEWKNLQITPYQSITLSPANATLHYAFTVFEGLKAYKNPQGEVIIFRPKDNAKRLNISAERMCIPQVPEPLFMQALTELIRLDSNWVPTLPGTSLYIRPLIFATDEYIGVKPSENFCFMIITCPAESYYAKPVNVKIETGFARAFAGGTGFAKAGGNYAASLYPAKLAQQKGFDQLIWTDAKHHEYIEESGTMNVMFILDDTLITPPTSGTILKGITRDSVLTIASAWGIKVEERPVSVKEIVSAAREGRLQEAFGVGTAATIAKIAKIGFEEAIYEIKEPSENTFSDRILKELNDIRTGAAEDRYGWTFKV